jgi:hypothetical protein
VADAGSLYTLSTGNNPPVPLNDPVRAEAETGSGAPTETMSVPNGGSMTASAYPTKVMADGQIGGDRNGTFGSAGTTHVTATTTITSSHTAQSEASSLTENLKLVAGQVTIGSVTSHAKVTTDGVKTSASGDTNVSNVKVGGIPVTVDQNGVRVSGKGPAIKVLNDQVNKILTNFTIEIFVTQPVVTTSAGGTSYESGSLLISFNDGGNYIVIGDAIAVAGSSLATPYTPPPSLPPFVAPPATGTAGTPAVPGGTGTLTPPVSAPLAPVETPVPQPQLASNSARLPSGALAAGWLVAALLGSGLIAFGLWRLPDRLLEDQPTPCPLGENT